MRAVLLASVLLLGFTASAAAQGGPNAREAYVERRGLLEVDAQCQLLQPSVRDALSISAAQARGSLLRAGWTSAQMRTLENTVVSAARARPCNDPRTRTAAEDARRVVAQWVNAGTMEFPGWERRWTARRANEGWRLSQAIDAPLPAVFGVRQSADAAQRLTLLIPVARGETAPSRARLILRNPQRARDEVSLNQRIALGLEAGAPSPIGALTVPSTQTVERLSGGRSQAVFAFPDTAFRDLVLLDPRESVVLEVQNGRATHRLLVEVGDIAAARAFLTIRR